jgi:hypothetical protein
MLTGVTTEVVGRSPIAGDIVALITAETPGELINPFVQHLPQQ